MAVPGVILGCLGSGIWVASTYYQVSRSPGDHSLANSSWEMQNALVVPCDGEGGLKQVSCMAPCFAGRPDRGPPAVPDGAVAEHCFGAGLLHLGHQPRRGHWQTAATGARQAGVLDCIAE